MIHSYISVNHDRSKENATTKRIRSIAKEIARYQKNTPSWLYQNWRTLAYRNPYFNTK